jgi:ribose 5-phosphate isomerase RpiB
MMRIGIAADHGGFELKAQLISKGPNGSSAVLRKWRHWKKR